LQHLFNEERIALGFFDNQPLERGEVGGSDLTLINTRTRIRTLILTASSN
jgi:hypothetical protein